MCLLRVLSSCIAPLTFLASTTRAMDCEFPEDWDDGDALPEEEEARL